VYLGCKYFAWKAVFNARQWHSFDLCVKLIFTIRAILRSFTYLEESNLILFFFAFDLAFLKLLAMVLRFTQLVLPNPNRLQ
jgi:hypothetical protein